MRKWALTSVAAVVVVAVIGAVAYIVWFRPEKPSTGEPKAPATTTVKRRDLSTSIILDGDIGYGSTTTLSGRKDGTITRLPSVGDVVRRGERLYSVDAEPVVLFLGKTPLYRTIDGKASSGPDVAEINTNLRSLGYGTAPAGNRYTYGTKIAIKQWQRRNGLDPSGELSVGDVAVLPKPVRVDSVKAEPGADAESELMELTSTKKCITAAADPSEVDTGKLTSGTPVTLSLPGNGKAKGTISGRESSGGSSQEKQQGPASGGDGSGDDKETITITVDDRSQLSDVESGPVEVTVPSESREDVLAVPVEALVAVQDGGFGLQVVADNGHGSTLVGVDTGMFADGLVQVSGKNIADGTKVVTIS